MCGRYQLEYALEQLMARFHAEYNYDDYEAKQEIFPTNTVAIITRNQKQNLIEPAHWGLENYYDKKPLINARGETVVEKRTFKNLLLENRCIIPATAFFEWKTENKKKVKFQIRPSDTNIFAMAGIYKIEKDIYGIPIKHFVVITTAANEAMSKIHDRMPVILTKENEDIWLNPSYKDPELLIEFMKSYSGPLTIAEADSNLQIQMSMNL